MHSAIHLPQVHHRTLSVAVLSAMLCLASATSLAAVSRAASSPTFSSPLLKENTPGLKLDLGLAVKGDECEEDYADLMQVSVPAGGLLAADARRQGGGEALFAQLASTIDFTLAGPAADSRRQGSNVGGHAPLAQSGSAIDYRYVTQPAGIRAPAPIPVVRIAAAKLAPPPAAVAAAPVAAPRAVPVAPSAPPAGRWEVLPSDKTLNAALARWAAAAGWQLSWELPVDYAVSVRTEIGGSFPEAVGQVAKSMDTAEIPMKAIFYDGNRVLRIVAKGTEQ